MTTTPKPDMNDFTHLGTTVFARTLRFLANNPGLHPAAKVAESIGSTPNSVRSGIKYNKHKIPKNWRFISYHGYPGGYLLVPRGVSIQNYIQQVSDGTGEKK